jgi:peptidoglycan/LPS O-acetylase OafA/YrhL
VDAASTARRVDSLTGLRIVAAAVVFLSHVPAHPSMPTRLTTFMAAGYNGVTLFFTLSGFVLAWNYADRLARPAPGRVWSFAVARLARIYPLYLGALLWVAAPALLSSTVPARSWVHVLAAQTWSGDLTFAYALNGPGWSVGVELFLYACFPLLIAVLAPLRRDPRVIAGVIAASVLLFASTWWFVHTGRGSLPHTDPGSAHRWLYRMPATRLFDFVVGMGTALLVRSVRLRAWVGATAQAAAVVAFALLMTWPSLTNTAWSWDAAYLPPTAALIWGLAVSPSTVLARVLGSRLMVVAGEASFAFYLFHITLIGRFGIGPYETVWGWTATVLMAFTMVLVFSVGAHFGVERPAQRWLRRALDRRRPFPSSGDPGPAATRGTSRGPTARTDGRASGRPVAAGVGAAPNGRRPPGPAPGDRAGHYAPAGE